MIGQTGKGGREMWGHSLEFWQSIFFWATTIALMAGGIGITAAFVSAIVGYKIADRVQQEANERISDANARGEEAKSDAALANERAAEANLALAKLKAPRSLTDSQQLELREKLKLFTDVSVDILRYGETAEIFSISKSLLKPLSEAGWAPRDFTMIGGGAAIGILVMVKPESDSNIDAAADALVSAMQGVGLTSGRWATQENWASPARIIMGPAWDANNIAPIRIVIGTKP